MLATLGGSATRSSWRTSSLKRIFLSVPVGMVSGNMHDVVCGGVPGGGVRACVCWSGLLCMLPATWSWGHCCAGPRGHGATVMQAHVEIEPLWPWLHRHVSCTGPRHRVCTCADKVSCCLALSAGGAIARSCSMSSCLFAPHSRLSLPSRALKGGPCAHAAQHLRGV
jgi:hypothetical protein